VALAPFIALIFVIGLFPNLFLSRMTEGVRVVVERYQDGLKAYRETDPETTKATLAPRRGGPLERGYPEAPAATPSGSEQALNAEAGK
jgi:hypothetical protein